MAVVYFFMCRIFPQKSPQWIATWKDEHHQQIQSHPLQYRNHPHSHSIRLILFYDTPKSEEYPFQKFISLGGTDITTGCHYGQSSSSSQGAAIELKININIGTEC